MPGSTFTPVLSAVPCTEWVLDKSLVDAWMDEGNPKPTAKRGWDREEREGNPRDTFSANNRDRGASSVPKLD